MYVGGKLLANKTPDKTTSRGEPKLKNFCTRLLLQCTTGRTLENQICKLICKTGLMNFSKMIKPQFKLYVETGP